MCVPVCMCCFNFLAMKRNLHPVPQEESDSDTSEELSIPTNGDLRLLQNTRKQKRIRTAFSNKQLDQLELAFCKSPYPDTGTRLKLASDLSINEDRIQVCYMLYLYTNHLTPSR